MLRGLYTLLLCAGSSLPLPPSVVLINATFNATSPTVIPNAFSAFTSWDPQQFSSTEPPADFAERYPYLRTVEFFTATGGCYEEFPGCAGDTRDLFNDNSNPASGVNASRLFAPLRHVLAAGLKPHIVTGNVPIALSSPPVLGGFGVNAALPRNLTEYSTYIEAVARQLAAEFGPAEVGSWRWGVFTEYNNQDWLIANATQYAALYDFTVCGLERALGAANVDVGVHACTQCDINDPKRHWDALLFLEHAAHGASACTGGRVHLNWTGNSFYEDAPGAPGDLSWWAPQALPVLQRAAALGLPTARFGIDEGRLLSGPDGLPLTSRAVGDAYQASWDALLFARLAATGVSGAYYARWGVSTGSLFDPAAAVADNAAANLARLAWALAGSRAVAAVASPGQPPPPPATAVAAVVGAGGDGALRALVAHHVPSLDASAAPAVLACARICGLPARAGAAAGAGGGARARRARHPPRRRARHVVGRLARRRGRSQPQQGRGRLHGGVERVFGQRGGGKHARAEYLGGGPPEVPRPRGARRRGP